MLFVTVSVNMQDRVIEKRSLMESCSMGRFKSKRVLNTLIF